MAEIACDNSSFLIFSTITGCEKGFKLTMAENANLGDDECLKAALQSGNVQHYRLKCMECRIREGLKKKMRATEPGR